jgi:hypothetical protein
VQNLIQLGNSSGIRKAIWGERFTRRLQFRVNAALYGRFDEKF